ncbi:hypothetical protein SAMN05519103_07631 [Rhizobiales bacterium GAS113]|nr:hypothetical protein SAMN05519103_07631 [Rhizobiales bacterium GAS113]
MFSRGGFDAKRRKRRPRDAEPALDAIATQRYPDPAKRVMMKYFGELVAEGFAEWELVENGNVRFRVETGETFVLGETAITRLA